MSRTLSLLAMAVVLGACAQVDVVPPPSLSDQLAASVEDRTDAVAVTVGESEELGPVSVRVARVGPDDADLTLQTDDVEATTSSLEIGEQARVGSVTVRLVDVAADTVWVAADVATPGATPSSTTDGADSS